MKQMKLMVFIFLAVLAGCKSRDHELSVLQGQEWQLKSLTEAGETVNNPRELPTLVFSDSSRVYGSAGCNRFFGTYTADEKGQISITPGGATMMFCPDMAFEDQYLKALPKVKSFVVRKEELILKDAESNLQLVYVPKDTTRLIGVAEDAHGCNAAAGYTWSEVRQNCVRLFEEGVKFVAAAGQDSTMAAYVVFATDSLKAEVFMPDNKINPVLERRQLPQGGYTWNQEDDDTWNVRKVNGNWVIEQRGQVMYSQAD